MVSHISFMRFCILGMSKHDRNFSFFQDIKYRDPIFVGRFHQRLFISVIVDIIVCWQNLMNILIGKKKRQKKV